MVQDKIVRVFVTSLIIFGFYFLLIPQKAYSQITIYGCCQYESFCELAYGGIGETGCTQLGGQFFQGYACNNNTLKCYNPPGSLPGSLPPPTTIQVPAFSEWGFLMLAVLFGIIGFIGIRKKINA